MSSEKMSPAKSVDSFRQTMIAVLNLMERAECYEWGAGHSTQIMANHPNVRSLDSVESDKFYLDMVRNKFDVGMVNFHYEESPVYYYRVRGDNPPYDFVFVDGRLRNQCLDFAHSILKRDGVVMLHDAERPEYHDAISKYAYRFHTDNGNTAVLTNDKDRASQIKRLLSSDSF